MKILLAAATEAEIAPAVAWLGRQDAPLQQRFDVLTTGIGLMAATFSLTQALTGSSYDGVVGAGIAGAFDRSLSLGECVIVHSEQQGDLGAEDKEEFLDLASLGYQQQHVPPYSNGLMVNTLQGLPFDTAQLQKVSGLTVNTVSGSARTIASRSARYSAQIESMEGAALHYVCLQLGLPFLQLRAISNYVTPRDRSAWKIAEAIEGLNNQLIDWMKR